MGKKHCVQSACDFCIGAEAPRHSAGYVYVRLSVFSSSHFVCVLAYTPRSQAPTQALPPGFCRILYSMRQKAGEEPGNEATRVYFSSPSYDLSPRPVCLSLKFVHHMCILVQQIVTYLPVDTLSSLSSVRQHAPRFDLISELLASYRACNSC